DCPDDVRRPEPARLGPVGGLSDRSGGGGARRTRAAVRTAGQNIRRAVRTSAVPARMGRPRMPCGASTQPTRGTGAHWRATLTLLLVPGRATRSVEHAVCFARGAPVARRRLVTLPDEQGDALAHKASSDQTSLLTSAAPWTQGTAADRLAARTRTCPTQP